MGIALSTGATTHKPKSQNHHHHHQQPIASFRNQKTNTTESLWVRSKREKSLNFCSKGITQLHPSICRLSSLETLQLCCNSLTLLPKELFMLSSLKTISLSRNGLTRIPEELGILAGLTELNLSHNKISSIPKTIVHLQRLKVLNLDSNCIEEVPQEIGFLPNLTYLELSRNPVQHLPIEIARLTGLRKLRLEECPLIGEEKYVFEDEKIYRATENKCFSLKSIAGMQFARQTVLQAKNMRRALEEHPQLPTLLNRFLQLVGECSFCHGPLFEEHILRLRFIQKGEFIVPFAYKMCCNHWRTEEGRILGTFNGEHHLSSMRQLCLTT